jgi:hypothetical protein
MPWAVAWYANRKCLLLPESLRAFRDISDYGVLGSPVAGLYLTPISGRQECYDLIKGRYKDWGPSHQQRMHPLRRQGALVELVNCIEDIALWLLSPDLRALMVPFCTMLLCSAFQNRDCTG